MTLQEQLNAMIGIANTQKEIIAEQQAEIDKLQEVLKQIASCESHHPDDVVSIARAALAAKDQR